MGVEVFSYEKNNVLLFQYTCIADGYVSKMPLPRRTIHQSFTRGGSAPMSSPLPFYILFSKKKVLLFDVFNKKYHKVSFVYI